MAFEQTSFTTMGTRTVTIPTYIRIERMSTDRQEHALGLDISTMPENMIVDAIVSTCKIKHVQPELRKHGVSANPVCNWDGKRVMGKAEKLFAALQGMGKSMDEIREISGSAEKVQKLCELLNI
jgi:hypothetical protein